MTNTLILNISGFKMINNGNMVKGRRWLFFLKLTDPIKLWWFLPLSKSKRQHSLTSKSIILNCWRRDMSSLISTTKSKNSKALKWKEEDNWDLQKFFNKKFSLNISKEPLYKNAMLIALRLPRSTWQLYKSKASLWILIKFWTIYNNQGFWAVNWQIMAVQKVSLWAQQEGWLNF
jgi:hypothetical protein